MKKSVFWADQVAEEIISRKRFHYESKPVPKFREYVIKTAASLSGVLHIGRLSDTIRCDSVYKSLKENGKKARLIWVADDMDPLRKIPKGLPESYSKYIGMPVTDIPDPHGCHKSYGEHHVSKYLEVVRKFVSDRLEVYSMREEYRKGSFRGEIQRIIDNRQKIIEIQNKYRGKENQLRKGWFPWIPVCGNCGKIITTHVVSADGTVRYECRDYKFEKHTAKGCGHRGENDPLKGNGKLLYKGELAVQWAHWKVSSEGFGKEYQVPGSAFWINGEIAERILGFPTPVPVFYEHMLIDGEKMSASKGNVVYPADWLKVAQPEILRFLYNKKLMKTRSFSWSMLPILYDDYDMHERVYFGDEKVSNEKEREHMKRLYEISQISIPSKMPLQIPFDFAAMVSQVFPDEKVSEAIEVFKSSGHIKGKPSKSDTDSVRNRLSYARNWVELYAPEQYRIKLAEKPPEAKLSCEQKKGIQELALMLEKKKFSQEELHSAFWEIAKKNGISAQEFFRAVYLVLLNKDSGPKLAPFILAVGQKKIAGLLKQVK
ncbi:MAG: lysine--tRNA ligase [Candidatus Aenigmarchaeota archaeon]|nr:lysine--tRNA ligase [Candidatus Aenigmarchaeota archaeon]